MTLMAVAVLASILAGCTTKGNTACPEETSCATSAAPSTSPGLGLPPPPRGNLSLPDATYPSFQMTGCEMYGAALELPADKLRPLIPDAFEPWGLTNGNPTAGAMVVIHACSRSLDNASVFGASTIYGIHIRAHPKNYSWTEEGIPNFYLVDLVADNDGLIRAAGNMSLSVSRAAISKVKVDLPDGSFASRWSVDAQSWDAALDYPNPADSTPQPVNYEFHYWYGTGPFHRISYQDSGASSGHIAPGDFMLQGSATISAAMPGPTVPFTGNFFADKNALLQYDGAWKVQ